MIQSAGDRILTDRGKACFVSRIVTVIVFLDQAIQNLVGERRNLALVCDTKGCGNVELLKIGANSSLKEGVDRGDLCASKLKKLAL